MNKEKDDFAEFFKKGNEKNREKVINKVCKKAFNDQNKYLEDKDCYCASFKCISCGEYYPADKINNDRECVNCEDETWVMDGDEILANMSVGCIVLAIIVVCLVVIGCCVYRLFN